MNQSASNGYAITIIESEIGPLISESRATVYDVMDAHDEGYSPSEIGRLYNLRSTTKSVNRNRVFCKNSVS